MSPIRDVLAALWRTLAALDGRLAAPAPAPVARPGDTHSRKVLHWDAAVKRWRVMPNRAGFDALAANLLIAATGNGTVRVVEEERA